MNIRPATKVDSHLGLVLLGVVQLAGSLHEVLLDNGITASSVLLDDLRCLKSPLLVL